MEQLKPVKSKIVAIEAMTLPLSTKTIFEKKDMDQSLETTSQPLLQALVDLDSQIGTESCSLGGITTKKEIPNSLQNQVSNSSEQIKNKNYRFKDALPRYDVNPVPHYPQVAKLRGWEGKVVFEVLILKNGRVGQLEVLASSGYRSLDSAARKAINRWKFSPATSFGVSIDSKVEIPVTFSLKDL
ncbi:MAG: energy transducer TonB [Desulfuromusa sp.]